MYEFAAELETTSSFDELWTGLVRALASQGITSVIYITASGTPPHGAAVHSTIPELYDGVDPNTEPFLLHSCDNYDITVLGPEFLSEHEYLSDGAKAFVRRARALGFQSGFGIPTRLRCARQYGGFILGTDLSADKFMADFAPRADEFRLFCLLMHRKIEELGGVANECDQNMIADGVGGGLGCLSPRELEVVTLLARGTTRKEAAHICGISQYTLSDYAKSAYRKLGIHNRAQAAQLIFGSSPAVADRKTA